MIHRGLLSIIELQPLGLTGLPAVAATTTAAIAAAAAALFSRLGFVGVDFATVEYRAGDCRHCCVGLNTVRHLNEIKAT